MQTTKSYSNQRQPGREHFPLYPKGFIALRIVQLVLAVVVIGLTGFGVTYAAFSEVALLLFTGIATLITCVYIIVAEFGAPSLYNYWAILSLDIFLLVLWLISFALVGAGTAALAYLYCYGYGYCSGSSGYETVFAVLAGAAAVGGLEFVLFIISLVIHSIMLHRHRKAGLHCTPIKSSGGHDTPAAAASAGGETVTTQPQMQQHTQQPQSGYANQPVVPPQPIYSAPHQEYYPQQVPQQAPSPLSAHDTGNSIQQQNIQHHQVTPLPGQGIYEVHGKSGHFQGPYETHGHSAQQPAQ